MLIGRSVFASPCGRSPRADEVMAFGRRTVTMSFSGLRPIFAIGGSAGAVCGSVEPRGPAVPRRMGLRRRFAALMSRAGRSLRTRRPATALTLRAGAPQAAARRRNPEEQAPPQILPLGKMQASLLLPSLIRTFAVFRPEFGR